jgi:hypothetical protein
MDAARFFAGAAALWILGDPGRETVRLALYHREYVSTETRRRVVPSHRERQCVVRVPYLEERPSRAFVPRASGGARGVILLQEGSEHLCMTEFRASVEGHLVDALASRGDEGRGTLRKASGRWEQPLIRRCPNGETRPARVIPC